ncbi:MAG: energy-coupling factor transporter transmembrane component T family protein [Pseudanabaenaceae cyanobacterium]
MDFLRSQAIGLYLEQPVTWLHRIDARVKILWVLSLLISPILANNYWRLGMVVLLILVTLSTGLPMRVWKQQMGILLLLASLTYAIAIFSGDALLLNPQPRRPTSEFITYAPYRGKNCPQPQPTDYCYTLFKVGRLQITRRSQDLGVRISTVIFTYTYAPTLFLLVTATEEITAAITFFATPLRFIGVPVAELALTLTLALRFIPLVIEEVQNLARAVRTRSINWRKLGYRRSVETLIILLERFLRNLFDRSEQIARAMILRGFTDPDHHQSPWIQLQLRWGDMFLILLAILFWTVRLLWVS